MNSSPHRPRVPSPIPLGVGDLFEKLTLDLWAAGWQHYSADAVLHRIRWHHHVDIGDRSFKCNNNWTAVLARWCMAVHPEIGDFFRTRASPHYPRLDPYHSSEDYMGPFT
jgi:hypothetical protein